MRSSVSKLTLVTVSAAFLLGAISPAFAQTEASAPSASETKAAAKAAKKQARAQARAQHKAERKAARAKNAAELKRLEDAGYKPAANDPNYPQNLQDAQKKVNAAGAASQ